MNEQSPTHESSQVQPHVWLPGACLSRLHPMGSLPEERHISHISQLSPSCHLRGGRMLPSSQQRKHLARDR